MRTVAALLYEELPEFVQARGLSTVAVMEVPQVGGIPVRAFALPQSRAPPASLLEGAEILGFSRVFGRRFHGPNATDAEQILYRWFYSPQNAAMRARMPPGVRARIAPSRPACGPGRQNCRGLINSDGLIDLVDP